MFCGTLLGCATFASVALAQGFANQLPAGCSKEVSAQITKGKSFHGAKCNSPTTCVCSAFLCTKKGKTVYEQVTCQPAPQ
jgi:hypothetical protein